MRNFKTTLTLATLLIAGAASAAPSNTTWIARLTGHLSCEGKVVQNSTLGQALDELEQQDVVVQEGKVARLDGRLFCMSCECPDGTYNVAKVHDSEQVENLVQSGGWERVEASEIRPTASDVNVEDSADAQILPVIPRI